MTPSRRHSLIAILSGILMVFALLDFLLWKTDPSGVVTFFTDWHTLQTYATPVPDGYRYAPGTIAMTRYTAAINADGFRAVPESRGGSCRIAFIGDSMTFGMGSDISFVNLLASQMDATVINAGIPGYNIENITALIGAVPADGYIWLMYANDDEPPARWHTPEGLPPALLLYRDALTARVPEHRPAYFLEHARSLLSRPDVLAFAFEGVALTDAAVPYGAVPIANYTQAVSRYDGHPTASGHAQIADQMRLTVIEFTSQQCERNQPNG